jgi:hypothetical protein
MDKCLARCVLVVLTALFQPDDPRRTTEGISIAEVKRLGREVVRDESAAGRPVVQVNLNNTKATDASLEKLTALHDLERPYLGNTGITDAGLAHVEGFHNWSSCTFTRLKLLTGDWHI